jgi:hypothetical protein
LGWSGDEARRVLRKDLGLGRGAVDEAHHLIPLGESGHEIVQRAARSGFEFNGRMNGMPLSFDRHRGVNIFHHEKYNKAVRSKLDKMLAQNPNISDAEAARFLADYAEQLRAGINRSTGRLR